MFVIEKDKNEIKSLPAKEIKFASLKTLGSDLAQKILKSISDKAKSPFSQTVKRAVLNLSSSCASVNLSCTFTKSVLEIR